MKNCGYYMNPGYSPAMYCNREEGHEGRHWIASTIYVPPISTCQFCGQPDGELHVCASGTWATIKVSRPTYDLWKLRMESIGLALGEMSPGDEPTKGQYVSWFEKSLTLLDVPCSTIRRWFDSGDRR